MSNTTTPNAAEVVVDGKPTFVIRDNPTEPMMPAIPKVEPIERKDPVGVYERIERGLTFLQLAHAKAEEICAAQGEHHDKATYIASTLTDAIHALRGER